MFTRLVKTTLLFSFLRDLKQKDFIVYLFVMVCILVQLIVTVIKLNVTPFFLFGMYSEKFVASDTFSITKVLVNDKAITAYNTPLREQYLVETNAMNYIGMKRNNYTDVLKTRIEQRYPVIYKSALYPFLAQRIYNTQADQNNFKSWLKSKCLKMAGMDSGTVKIVETTYFLNRATLHLNPIRHETLEVL